MRHLAGFPEACYLERRDLLSSHIPQPSQGLSRKSGKIKRKAANLRDTIKPGFVSCLISLIIGRKVPLKSKVHDYKSFCFEFKEKGSKTFDKSKV